MKNRFFKPGGAALAAVATLGALALPAHAQTVGDGTVYNPASGPAPSYGIGGNGMVLVKNWDFGSGGTIKNYADMNQNFFYHDQFLKVDNGGKYGSKTVSPDTNNALGGQPIEGVNCPPVREFTATSLKTYLQPLDGATTASTSARNVGNGSFMAKWRLPRGGSLLGRDIVWETRVRYVTPRYFWFSIWTAGNKWLGNSAGSQGAEHDLVESYGEDAPQYNYQNYDGRFWHANSVAAPSKDNVNYSSWSTGMSSVGITSFDPTQYHTWTWHFKKNNTFDFYCDGVRIQTNKPNVEYWWTYGNTSTGEPIDVRFLFDAAWGHNVVGSMVGKSIPASELAGKLYEWDYSRVYLGTDGQAPYNGPHILPKTIKAADYDKGGAGVAYNQTVSGGQTGYRTDNSGALYGGGTGLGWTSAGQWYKYTVNSPTGGAYKFSFSVASATTGGTFHVEDETGRNLTGSVSVPNTGSTNTFTTVNVAANIFLSSGGHVLKWVQDGGGYNLASMTITKATGTSEVVFVKSDGNTQGNWKGVYGADGYNIIKDTSANNPKQPAYGTLTVAAPWSYTFASSTSDGRALQKAATGSTDRVAGQWGANLNEATNYVDFTCNFTDANTHQVAFYALDWNRAGRHLLAEARDAATGTVLDSQELNSFPQGVYFVWNVRGSVVFRFRNITDSNVAISAVFFDPLPNNNGNGTGLKGQYFNDLTLSTVINTQTDPQINFNWGTGGPTTTSGSAMSSIGADWWTARWTGKIQPRFSETYTFTASVDDGVKLWVNGQQIINAWTANAKVVTGTVALSAGQQVDIKMEYLEYTGAATAKLEWQSASQAKEVVPQSQLYPAP